MIRAALLWIGILFIFLLIAWMTGPDFDKEKFVGWHWILLGTAIGLIVK